MMDLIIVVPVLEENRHFSDGDLKEISGFSLVQWKLNSLPNLISEYPTYIYSNKNFKLINYSRKINYLKRKDNTVQSLIIDIKERFIGKKILWLNCNTPFVREETIQKAIEEYESLLENFSSFTTVIMQDDFFIMNNKPLNFSFESELSRVNNIPILKMTHSFYLFEADSVGLNLLSKNTFFYKISKEEAFELSDDLSEEEIKAKFFNFLMVD